MLILSYFIIVISLIHNDKKYNLFLKCWFDTTLNYIKEKCEKR